MGDIVAGDIDAYNVLSVLRAKLWGLPEAETRSLIISPTHKITSATLNRMIGAESVSEAVKLSGKTPSTVQATRGDEQLIDEVEEALSGKMRDTAARAFVWQGLGPGASLALVRLMEFEVNNLAAISIGVEAGMDPRTILSKLKT